MHTNPNNFWLCRLSVKCLLMSVLWGFTFNFLKMWQDVWSGGNIFSSVSRKRSLVLTFSGFCWSHFLLMPLFFSAGCSTSCSCQQLEVVHSAPTCYYSSNQSTSCCRLVFFFLFLSKKAKVGHELPPELFPIAWLSGFFRTMPAIDCLSSDIWGNYDPTRSPVPDSLCQ